MRVALVHNGWPQYDMTTRGRRSPTGVLESPMHPLWTPVPSLACAWLWSYVSRNREKPGLTLNADGRCLQEARARFFLRRVVNVKPRTSQVNPSSALVSWRGATSAGKAVCGERKHDLFFVEFACLLGLSYSRRYNRPRDTVLSKWLVIRSRAISVRSERPERFEIAGDRTVNTELGGPNDV